MKSFRWIAIKLAIFTVVTLIVTTWLASIIGNFQFFSDRYQVTAQFNDVSGLLKGDVVKAAGVTIGKVSDIGVDKGIATVTMSLDPEAEVPEAVGAQIRFRNLVGQRMVTLVATNEVNGVLLSDGDVIPLVRTEGAFDLSALFNGLRPLIRSADGNDINLVTRAVVQALKGRSADVESLLANLGALGETVASKDAGLRRLLDGLNIVTSDLAERDTDLSATLADLNTFLGDLAAGKDDLSQAVISLDDAARRFKRIVDANGDDIEAEVEDLAVILDAVNDRRGDLRGAVRALPEMLVAIERVSSYGEWTNIHLVHVCKVGLGSCGTRWAQ